MSLFVILKSLWFNNCKAIHIWDLFQFVQKTHIAGRDKLRDCCLREGIPSLREYVFQGRGLWETFSL